MEHRRNRSRSRDLNVEPRPLPPRAAGPSNRPASPQSVTRVLFRTCPAPSKVSPMSCCGQIHDPARVPRTVRTRLNGARKKSQCAQRPYPRAHPGSVARGHHRRWPTPHSLGVVWGKFRPNPAPSPRPCFGHVWGNFADGRLGRARSRGQILPAVPATVPGRARARASARPLTTWP